MVELYFESTKPITYYTSALHYWPLCSCLRSMHILSGQNKSLLGIHPLAGHKCERTLFIYIRA